MRDVKLIKIMLGVQVVVIFFALWLNLWAVPSLITSSIKSIAKDCDKTYPVEKIWSANLFCPEKYNGK